MLHHLFGTRTRVLMSDLAPQSQADYLSGLLIGHETNSIGATGPVLVIGAAEVEARYLRAFRLAGREASALSGPIATARGLRFIERLMGAAQQP